MPRQPPLPWISPGVLDQILLLGQEAAPNEACGIVTPDQQVISLSNQTPTNPGDSYAVDGDELVEAISEYSRRCDVQPESLTRAHFIIWHTHPGGQIGPSKGDLETRLPDFQYVVVTLPNGEAARF